MSRIPTDLYQCRVSWSYRAILGLIAVDCARLVIGATMSVTVVSYAVVHSSRLFNVLAWFPVSAVEPR